MYLTPPNAWAPQASVSSQSSLVATHTLAADVTLLTLSCESVDVAHYNRMLASIEQVLASVHRVILALGSVSFLDSPGPVALVPGPRRSLAQRFPPASLVVPMSHVWMIPGPVPHPKRDAFPIRSPKPSGGGAVALLPADSVWRGEPRRSRRKGARGPSPK